MSLLWSAARVSHARLLSRQLFNGFRLKGGRAGLNASAPPPPTRRLLSNSSESGTKKAAEKASSSKKPAPEEGRASAAAAAEKAASKRNGTGSSSSSSSSSTGGGANSGRVVERVPVTWTSLGLAVMVGGALVAYYQKVKLDKETQAVSKVTSYGKPALGGPFTLVNIDGEPVTDATFSDGFMLLYFGFTYCPDICPSELVKMGKIMERLDADGRATKDRVTPVFVSLDCKRDSLEQLKNYSKDFHEKVQFLIGTPGQVEAAARAYRVYFSDTNELDDDDTDYLIDHSIVMYLVAPDGEFQEFYTQLASVQECVERITATIEKYEAEQASKSATA